jgi:hypothetical protein
MSSLMQSSRSSFYPLPDRPTTAVCRRPRQVPPWKDDDQEERRDDKLRAHATSPGASTSRQSRADSGGTRNGLLRFAKLIPNSAPRASYAEPTPGGEIPTVGNGPSIATTPIRIMKVSPPRRRRSRLLPRRRSRHRAWGRWSRLPRRWSLLSRLSACRLTETETSDLRGDGHPMRTAPISSLWHKQDATSPLATLTPCVD